MALARVKVWLAGDTLTAADLNAEFNNILNNPVSLISPSTGAINFNLQAHTNLIPAAITASSAAGGVLIGSTGATTALWLPVGSSGQMVIAGTSGAPIYSTGMNFVTTARQLFAQRVGPGNTQATLLGAGNFTISAGWGTTASVAIVVGTDQAYRIQINSGNAGIAANPTITATYADGLWTAVPATVVSGGGGSAAPGFIVTSNSSGHQLQAIFTPAIATAYIFDVMTMG